MAADVEPEALVLDRAGDAADLPVLLEDAHGAVRGCTSRYAAVRPAGPAPMMMVSGVDWGSGIRARFSVTERRPSSLQRQPEQQERVVPRHVGGSRVNLPELRAHGHGGHEQRELRRRPVCRATTNMLAANAKNASTTGRLIAWFRGERRHEPAAQSACAGPRIRTGSSRRPPGSPGGRVCRRRSCRRDRVRWRVATSSSTEPR